MKQIIVISISIFLLSTCTNERKLVSTKSSKIDSFLIDSLKFPSLISGVQYEFNKDLGFISIKSIDIIGVGKIIDIFFHNKKYSNSGVFCLFDTTWYNLGPPISSQYVIEKRDTFGSNIYKTIIVFYSPRLMGEGGEHSTASISFYFNNRKKIDCSIGNAYPSNLYIKEMYISLLNNSIEFFGYKNHKEIEVESEYLNLNENTLITNEDIRDFK